MAETIYVYALDARGIQPCNRNARGLLQVASGGELRPYKALWKNLDIAYSLKNYRSMFWPGLNIYNDWSEEERKLLLIKSNQFIQFF